VHPQTTKHTNHNPNFSMLSSEMMAANVAPTNAAWKKPPQNEQEINGMLVSLPMHKRNQSNNPQKP
jgi:hypothetical protein